VVLFDLWVEYWWMIIGSWSDVDGVRTCVCLASVCQCGERERGQRMRMNAAQGRRQGQGAARVIINERRHRRVCEQRPKSRPTEKKRRKRTSIGENDWDGAYFLYKNDDKLCVHT
jgi:hypothetical protein